MSKMKWVHPVGMMDIKNEFYKKPLVFSLLEGQKVHHFGHQRTKHTHSDEPLTLLLDHQATKLSFFVFSEISRQILEKTITMIFGNDPHRMNCNN